MIDHINLIADQNFSSSFQTDPPTTGTQEKQAPTREQLVHYIVEASYDIRAFLGSNRPEKTAFAGNIPEVLYGVQRMDLGKTMSLAAREERNASQPGREEMRKSSGWAAPKSDEKMPEDQTTEGNTQGKETDDGYEVIMGNGGSKWSDHEAVKVDDFILDAPYRHNTAETGSGDGSWGTPALCYDIDDKCCFCLVEMRIPEKAEQYHKKECVRMFREYDEPQFRERQRRIEEETRSLYEAPASSPPAAPSPTEEPCVGSRPLDEESLSLAQASPAAISGADEIAPAAESYNSDLDSDAASIHSASSSQLLEKYHGDFIREKNFSRMANYVNSLLHTFTPYQGPGSLVRENAAISIFLGVGFLQKNSLTDLVFDGLSGNVGDHGDEKKHLKSFEERLILMAEAEKWFTTYFRHLLRSGFEFSKKVAVILRQRTEDVPRLSENQRDDLQKLIASFLGFVEELLDKTMFFASLNVMLHECRMPSVEERILRHLKAIDYKFMDCTEFVDCEEAIEWSNAHLMYSDSANESLVPLSDSLKN
ncbi:hypothetical protein BJ508DRAFT_326983 [Ascobolus immersus RN42]|uniref:Uncharacterized protein n=1 Tax=Ascobolus immersus RN42 TaxID=1160509 RepID=A0A3N4I453_ASCIM|nr:hypothetical protein BJ508DRAFT_326983 [Ascobolus immersus RN42]